MTRPDRDDLLAFLSGALPADDPRREALEAALDAEVDAAVTAYDPEAMEVARAGSHSVALDDIELGGLPANAK